MKFNPFAAKKANTNTTQTHFEKKYLGKKYENFLFSSLQKSIFVSFTHNFSANKFDILFRKTEQWFGITTYVIWNLVKNTYPS